MKSVKVSPKYQVVIPKEARDALGLKPGQEMVVFAHRGSIQMVPVQPVSELRGMLRGLDLTFEREEEDRL